jgi:hypothetical protein
MADSVVVTSDDPDIKPRYDPVNRSLSIDDEDGGSLVYINFEPSDAEKEDPKHFDNLAETLDEDVRNAIVEEVLRGVEADEQSRQEWSDMRAEGIKMLGTTLEKAGSDAGNSTQPFEGMSMIRHPLLAEAIIRAQANTAAELYPPSGPVKVSDDRPSKPFGIADIAGLGHNGGPPLDPDDPDYAEEMTDEAVIAGVSREELAEALERGFNYNLSVVDRGYRPDSVRMLFYVYFDGCAFKKVYDCPIRERPMSRFVQASDVIVSNGVSDERDAGRLTHRIVMRQSVVKRMQIAGAYRTVTLHEPSFQPTPTEQATATAQGLMDRPQRQEDQPRTLYESYVELDVPGLEHKRNGKVTGLPLPYKITIDKDAREMLEMRRNWEESDDTFQPRRVFVKFGMFPALGFYDLGFLHVLGNGDRALTAAWREALDCAMFGNFPGFMYNEGVIRNWTNQNRVPPGGGIGIKGVPPNLPLRNVLEPLPYKDVGVGMVQIIQHIEQRMDRVAGLADLPVGEGNADAPVGTTLALIEQATKPLAGVHVGLYGSLAEELGLLKARYQANPESFWRWNKKGYDWEESLFLRALEDCELVPRADPNTHSQMMRVMRAWAILQLAQQAPQLFKPIATARHFFHMIGVSNPDEFLQDQDPQPQDQPPPQDPAKMAAVQQRAQEAQQTMQAKMAELQLKGQQASADNQARMAEAQIEAQAQERDRQLTGQSQVVESADRAADRASRERVAAIRLQTEQMKIGAQATQQHLDRATGLAQSREERAGGLAQQREQQAHETRQAVIPKPVSPPSE